MDGDTPGNFIHKYADKFIMHKIKTGDGNLSFFAATKYIKSLELPEHDLIYFLENDYMHIQGWDEIILELFDMYIDLNYVSLYDHRDKYDPHMYPGLLSHIFISPSRHWRTTPSTCGSFIIPKKIFDEDYDILSTWVGDHEKFIWLGKNRGRTILTPMPGLSTHCTAHLLSPIIEWNKK